jgi:hypothetical protein
MGECNCVFCQKAKGAVQVVNNDAEVRFRHIRVVKDDEIYNMGGITVAFKEIAPGAITYAIARCSINDNFDKKKGRTIAEGRLNSPKHAETVPMTLEAFYKSLRDQNVFDYEDFV